ncbi:hypothetical protein C8A00DRAFT_36120 [Chaetomidium leptoderma]|uniref:Uncharacterized protein n=1 Tax=Chaetomidium leptoderma TaxID=669021 RepID=A0AAN6VHI2_9PEZI|nr:hypothetical protein C8A00DRAFT_36120 [Chaetomidium leptoderma]
MRFAIFAGSLLATLAHDTPVANADASVTTPPSDIASELFKPLCAVAPPGVNFVRDCDIAVNTVLFRNNDLNYGAAGSGKADGAQRGRCKIFLAGPRNCQRSGNDMWNDYQQIRAHGCSRCGTKTWGELDVCRTTVNYVA